MGLYNFKEIYYDHNGAIVEVAVPARFFSMIGTGDGTREKPANTNKRGFLAGGANIYSSGYHDGQIISGGNNSNSYIGQGVGKTVFNVAFTSYVGYHYFKDITIEKLYFPPNGGFTYFKSCEIKGDIPSNVSSTTSCLFRVNKGLAGARNSFVGIIGKAIPNATLNLFDSCDVLITSSDINNYRNNYLAFNNCKLKIGNEAGYTVLIGTTEEELRQNFVDRCTAQGITVSDVTDMGETLKQGRWVFSNDSCIDGLVLKDSTIHNFEKRRLIYFGYSDMRGDGIGISSEKNIKNSFSPAYPNKNVQIANQSISLTDTIDLSQKNTAYADTNIIWLGGKKQLNKLDILHNFPKEYGVFVDSTPTLSENTVTEIIPYANGEHRTYLIRSSNDLEATVTYNGKIYSSALGKLNHIFIGVQGVTSFVAGNNAEVYEILDEAMHQTIQMRIVNNIPAGNIAAGTPLTAGYWYLVEHDSDQQNTTDYVTYGGVKYLVGSSFLASGTATFAKTGNVHLRRCWKDAFDYNTETLDKAFWQNEQKPLWFDVLPDDLRCLLKYNNPASIEMQPGDNGVYITSGHEDFYNSIMGVNGTKRPAFPIKGTYMQLRLKITTLNPM